MDLLHRAEAENIELKKVNAETKDTMVIIYLSFITYYLSI